jgi:transposase
MSGFIVGADRNQTTLLPESLDDYVAEDSAVRVIDVFVHELDLGLLGFKTTPAETGRPGYHPGTMLKLFLYGYMNRVQSSHRLEREAQRNVELMWLTQRLAFGVVTGRPLGHNPGYAPLPPASTGRSKRLSAQSRALLL